MVTAVVAGPILVRAPVSQDRGPFRASGLAGDRPRRTPLVVAVGRISPGRAGGDLRHRPRAVAVPGPIVEIAWAVPSVSRRHWVLTSTRRPAGAIGIEGRRAETLGRRPDIGGRGPDEVAADARLGHAEAVAGQLDVAGVVPGADGGAAEGDSRTTAGAEEGVRIATSGQGAR